MWRLRDDSLYWACLHGNKLRVLELANQNSVNYVHLFHGDTPLHQACKQGWLDIVKLFIEKYGCDPNVVTRSNESPLHYACQYGQIDLVELLITKYGCDPNVLSKSNESLLHNACRSGHINLVELLIEKYGCDPNVVTKSTESLLHYACQYGHINLVELLIEKYGCDPNVMTKSNESLLHYACWNGHTDTVKYLINKQHLSPFLRENINQLEPLDYAISNNETDIVVYICQHCISSNGMLNPDRIKTTINLIKYIGWPNPRPTRSHRVSANPLDPRWKTADGDSILQLVGSSKTCISHLPLEIVLDFLKRDICKFNPDWRTADNDNLLELACQSEIFLSQTRSALLLEWLGVACINQVKLSIPDSKTADGDPLIQLVCQSETCIAHTSTAVISKWLRRTQLIQNLTKIITPKWKTADGHTLLQLVCQSEKIVSRIPSTVLTKWLTDSSITMDFNETITPDWRTADCVTLFQLICQSEKCLIRISSTVFLKWLRKTPLNFVKMDKSLETADGDTLLQLILRSPTSISRTSTGVLVKLLSCNREISINEIKNVNPKWKTLDGTPFLYALCQSNIEDKDSIELMQYYILEKVWNPDSDYSDSKGNTVLHIACEANKHALMSYLINQAQCDPNRKNTDGRLPLDMTTNPEVINHLCQYHQVSLYSKTVVGWITKWWLINDATMSCIVQSLVNNRKTVTKDGSTLLHVLCTCITSRDTNSLVEYLLTECQCDPNCFDSKGQTPLQLTSDIRIMKTLVEHGAQMTTDVVFKLISKHSTDSRVSELFKLSTTKGTMLRSPNNLNSDGYTALQLACKVGSFTLVNFLLSVAHCDPNIKSKNEEVPIQLTSDLRIMKTLVEYGAQMTIDVVFKLISKHNTDSRVSELFKLSTTMLRSPNDLNCDGYTTLHLACKVDSVTIVHFLLSTAHCDPNMKSKSGDVPLQMTTNPEIIKDLIRHGAKTSIMYKSYKKALGTNKPVQPPVKVFVVGNPSVGKSTLTAALKTEKNRVAQLFSSGKVSSIDEKTVGIVPHDLESGIFGRVTLYYFAGHREFYSGHAALLQTAIQSTPPIFLLVINLCDDNNEIIKNILYWISFLENQCASVSCKPHVIIVGSHADALKGVNPKDKVKAVTDSLDTKYFTNVEYSGFVAMNCKFHASIGMSDLRHLLTKSCQELRIHEPITFNAHCFLIYLIDKFLNHTAVTIKTVSETVNSQQSKEEGVLEFLPPSFEGLYKICLELNDRGHILLLKDRSAIENSYIVIDKAFLLSEISGTVFATEGFKQYKELSSNTGVVPLSKIVKSFPDSDINILIGFLTHLEFCHEISDQALLQHIAKDHSQASNESECYYLFPGLISLEADSNVWETESHFSHQFGWTLQCTNLEQFLTSRFLQVLLLRLAFSLALESKHDGSGDDVIGILRKCTMWKNGIYWGRGFDMETIVEVIEDKSIVVITRFQITYLEKCLEHRSKVIHTVLECLDSFCPRVSVTESFIDASSHLCFPSAHNLDKISCTVQALAESIVNIDPSVVLSSGKPIPAKSFLSFEPYTEIGPLTLRELRDKDNENKIISDNFLSKFVKKASDKLNWFARVFNDSAEIPSSRDDLYHELLQWRGDKMTYKELRQKLDQYSVFAGRNLLDLAGYKYEPPTDEGKEEMQIGGDQIPTLSVEDGKVQRLTEASTDSDLFKAAHSVDDKDQTDDCVASTVGVELPTAIITVKGRKPELHELQLLTFGEGKESVRIMETVTPKWKQVAIAFGFDGSRIEAIEMGAFYKPRRACLAMFTDWLAGGHDLQPPTWDALILSLRVAELTEVADLLSRTIKTGAKGVDADAPMRVDAKTQVASTAATSDAISGNVPS